MSKISVILPFYNQLEELKLNIFHLENQILLPDELIIVDSSDGLDLENFLTSKEFPFAISHYRNKDFDLKINFNPNFTIPFGLFHSKKKFFSRRAKRLYPPEATNFGALQAKNNLVAMLDVCTIPNPSWLKDYYDFLITNDFDIVFGSTIYAAKTKFQDLLKISTYGNYPLESNPGSLIKKKVLHDEPLIEGSRSGADIEWRPRIKKKYLYFSPKNSYLTYSSLPLNIFSAMKKFFIYQLHASRIRVQLGYKDLFLSLSLIFVTLILYKWNTYLGSLIYLPNVLKIFLTACNLFLLGLIILKRYSKNFSIKFHFKFTERTFKYLALVTLFFICYRWNFFVSEWLDNTSLYIPHITKTFLLLLLMVAISYRGIIFPLNRGYSNQELLPFKFLKVGLIGVLLDLAKLPGFILGSALSLVGVTFSEKK